MKYGKNIGFTIAEIYKYEPKYIEWLIVNVSNFKIDTEEFERLPTPTTLGYKSKNFPNGHSMEDDMNMYTISDFINPFDNVDSIKQHILKGAKIDELDIFHFPDNIKVINDSK